MSTCEYTFDNVVRIVIVSVIITLLIVGFFALVVWLYLCKRNAHKFDLNYDPHATQLNIIKSNQFNNNESRFAFDNPYFKDDENEFIGVTNNDKLNFNYNNENSDATILSNGAALNDEYNQTGHHSEQLNSLSNPLVKYVLKNNKITSIKPVQLVKKAWEADDVDKKPEKISVSLIGRDFTGLGFNIAGNMRDGIFIRDVLNRGPANESKKIKPGDKLSSITISMDSMVYEDALTILSYASPYQVTINLEREQKSTLNQKLSKNSKLSNLCSKRTVGNNFYQKTMLHPLYKTRSVDNLIQIGKHDHLNYGTTGNFRLGNIRDQEFSSTNNSRGYGRMINKFKQQILTYLNSSNAVDGSQQENEKKRRPLSSIQNLFKSNNSKLNWPEEYSGQDNLNAVVVGNNLAFKDDDEGDEFRRQYQISQLKHQQQQSVYSIQQDHNIPHYNPSGTHQQNNLRHQGSLQQNSLQQHNSLRYQQTIDSFYNRTNSLQPQQPNQHTNLIKYHQQTITDLSQVDNIQPPMNQFVNINFNEGLSYYSANNHHNRRPDDEMDPYANTTRKGNSSSPYSSQVNDSYDNSLISSSNQISLPVVENDRAQNTIIAEVHVAADQLLVNNNNPKSSDSSSDSNADPNSNEILNQNSELKNVNSNKPRSSSMNDLPNESIVVTMNPEVNLLINDNYQSSTLERAISLDLGSNQTGQKTTNLKLSKSIFINKFISKDDQMKNKKLIKIKNQINLNQQSIDCKNQSSSLGDLNYEKQQKNIYKLSSEKLSQPNLINNLTASLSNSKLSSQSKSIRNSLSTNSTCSSPSSLPSSDMNKMEYDDENSILMLKSTPENSNSILIKDHKLNLDDELDAKESIERLNEIHQINDQKNKPINKNQSANNDQLFANKDQVQKIINDVFEMSSIRTLNSIKSDKQLNDLFQLNKQAAVSSNEESSKKRSLSTNQNSTNSSLKSIKKDIPDFKISSLTGDHLNLFSSNVPSTKDNFFITHNDRLNSKLTDSKESSNQSLNKENELKLKINQDKIPNQSKSESSFSSIEEDELSQLKNRVSKLKKEFSLRQKEIENQNRQNHVNRMNKFRKLSDGQVKTKSILSFKENRPAFKKSQSIETDSISKKQEQILKSSALDFEPWTFNNE